MTVHDQKTIYILSTFKNANCFDTETSILCVCSQAIEKYNVKDWTFICHFTNFQHKQTIIYNTFNSQKVITHNPTFKCQYRVNPPRAFIKATQRRRIDRIRLAIKACGIACHSSITASSSCCTFTGGSGLA